MVARLKFLERRNCRWLKILMRSLNYDIFTIALNFLKVNLWCLDLRDFNIDLFGLSLLSFLQTLLFLVSLADLGYTLGQSRLAVSSHILFLIAVTY